jgi:acyl carrier protein
MYESLTGDLAAKVRAGLVIRGPQVVEGSTGQPLVALVNASGGLALTLEYDAQRFEAKDVRCMLTFWAAAIETLCAARSESVGELLMQLDGAAEPLRRELPETKGQQVTEPAPTGSASEDDSGNQNLATAMEHLVAQVWQEVLELDGVRAHDNFLDLGGHSLLMIRVVSMLEARLRVRLSPGELIYPTLRQLATRCEQAVEEKQNASESGGKRSRSLSGLLDKLGRRGSSRAPF